MNTTLHKDEKEKRVFDGLIHFGAISPFDLLQIDFLKDLSDNNFYDAQKRIFLLYFIFLRDGCTRMPLSDELAKRWNEKFEKLKKARLREDEQGNFVLNDEDNVVAQEIENYFANLSNDVSAVLKDGVCEPMVIANDHLYTQKSLAYAQSISERFKAIFSQTLKAPTYSEISAKIAEYKNKGKAIDEDQACAILCGLEGSLVITGGPGTGKTTVIAHLLQELKARKDFKEYKVYLAAPSGKASDRLRESIMEINGGILPQGYESMTIHRLLSFNPSSNEFTYNKEHKFSENAIFVIDEASMIDLELFAKLLEALPDEARVYLLGDKDQLPSVEAGAVLGELLASATSHVKELKISHRFDANSQVGRLAQAMQARDEDNVKKEIQTWEDFEKLQDILPKLPDSPGGNNLKLFNYPVATNGKPLNRTQKQPLLEKVLRAWRDRFCKLSDKRLAEITSDADYYSNDVLLRKAQSARILCAENGGVYGVDNINATMVKLMHGSQNNPFVGKNVMIIKNISVLNLFNGDSGILIKDKGEFCFMKSTSEIIPLRWIPSECIATSYASTIHKAQGSGYDNVLMFLPENQHSLLATRQIVYTGITRVKNGTLVVVGSEARFLHCCGNITLRDTGIEIGG